MDVSKKEPFLFKYFPDLRNNVTWIHLGTIDAPVHRLRLLEFKNLWIKRNDLISPLYGGNKVRRLEFILADVIKKGKKRVVTMGGIGSNHCLATAIFCRQLGLSCFLSLFEQPLTRYVQENLLLFHRHGAGMSFSQGILPMALDFYLIRKLRYWNTYFLESGGSSVIGILGAVNSALELKQQIDSGMMPVPKYIFYPTASNGGMAGLSLGFLLAGLDTTVIGVRVGASHLFGMELNTPGTVKRAMEKTYRFLKKNSKLIPDIDIQTPVIMNDFCGEGYGHPTKKGLEALEVFKTEANIRLEPVYTAKTCAALVEFIENHSSAHDPILYWHTFNSVDLSQEAASVDHKELPIAFHKFFKDESKRRTYHV